MRVGCESGSEDPEVPYDDSESALGDDDDEIFINNPTTIVG